MASWVSYRFMLWSSMKRHFCKAFSVLFTLPHSPAGAAASSWRSIEAALAKGFAERRVGKHSRLRWLRQLETRLHIF